MAINKNTLQEYFRNSLRKPELVIDTIVASDFTHSEYHISTMDGILYSYKPAANHIELVGAPVEKSESIPTIFQNQEQSQLPPEDLVENIKDPNLKEPYTSLQKHTKGLEYLICSLHDNWDRVEIEKVTVNPQKGPYQILDINFNVDCGDINSGSMNKTFRFKFEMMPEPKVEVKKSTPKQRMKPISKKK